MSGGSRLEYELPSGAGCVVAEVLVCVVRVCAWELVGAATHEMENATPTANIFPIVGD
jgi:hypothetical protein